MKKIFLLVALFYWNISFLEAKLINYDIKPTELQTDKYMGITILDSKELKFDSYNNIKFREISDLAFKKDILYALNDKGELFKLNINIEKDKIVRLKLKDAIKLKNKHNKNLLKSNRDSEGMVLHHEKLFISFEKNPRIEEYSLEGKNLKKIVINSKLRDIKDYVSPNKALEGLAYNKKYSFITAPELPFKNKKYHTLYSKKRIWKFRAEGSITALEFLDRNRIVVLQRDFNHFTRRRTTILSIVNLKKCKKHICQERVIANLKSADGWHLDNFEGLTKIDKNRFLMISDDNGSFFQKTLLVLFRIDKF